MVQRRFKQTGIVFALLILCGAALVNPALGGAIVNWGDTGSSVPSGTDFTAIAADGWDGLALRADGSLVHWGGDYPGGSGTPSGTDFTAVAIGSGYSLALRADGSIVAWGVDDYTHIISDAPSGTGFTAIAAGYQHALALRADGSIISWGADGWGQVSQTPTDSGYIAIDGGCHQSLALRADGSIVSWGEDYYGQVSDTPTGTGFTAIASGYAHNVALRADGSIVSWGFDVAGQVSQTPTDAGYIAVSAGGLGMHSLALRADGSIVSWGSDRFGQVSQTPTNVGFTAIAAGDDGNLALQSDTTSPTLTATVPANGATNVPVSTGITGTWSEPVTVYPPRIAVTTAGGTEIAYLGTWDATGFAVTPNDPLPKETVITVSVKGVTDLAGHLQDPNPSTWSFTTAANQRPVASLTAVPSKDLAPLAVTFSTAGTGDSDGGISTWALAITQLGVSATGSGTPPGTFDYTFTEPGTYTATLTVTDTDGATATATVDVVAQTLMEHVADLKPVIRQIPMLSLDIQTGLFDKLDQAELSLNSGSDKAAVSQLTAFVNQVKGLQKAKKLTAAQATALITEAQEIIAAI
ncbi:MAG: Ig-like domain-containing protein [Methanospirillum sp.]